MKILFMCLLVYWVFFPALTRKGRTGLVCARKPRLHKFSSYIRKIRAPIKIKSALPPQKKPPPNKKGILRTVLFLQKERIFFQVSIKLAHPFPAPELRTKKFYGHEDFSDYTLSLGHRGADRHSFKVPRCLIRKRSMVILVGQDTFDHDKGQKSAISGRRLHWRLSTGFFAFSPGSLSNLVRRAP